ncbi:hypothetical protein AB0C28_47265 [Nonomuraea sp. NPDC048892]|uniref:hypothetical protein n=1 Tax=Nonomuraea sp. NPDC048892 TaxID=3154624 RepID=UPI0033CE62F4
MPADEVGQVAGQRTQLLENFLVQLVDGDVGSHLGQLLALRSGLALPLRPAVPGPRTGTLLAVVPRERPGVALLPFPVTAETAFTTVAVATLTPVGGTLTTSAVPALAARPAIVTEPTFATGAPVLEATLTARSAILEPSTLATGTAVTEPALTTRPTIITPTAGTTRPAIVTEPTLSAGAPVLETALTTRSTILETTTLATGTVTALTTLTVTTLTTLTVTTLTTRTTIIPVPIGTTIIAFAARSAVLETTLTTRSAVLETTLTTGAVTAALAA